MAEAGYPQDLDDVVWIPQVAAKGWVILTKDRRIRRFGIEVRAMLNARARCFTLGRGGYTAQQMAEIILFHRPTIERLCNRRPPVIAQVNKGEVLLRDQDGNMQRVKRRRDRGTRS